MLDSVLIANRGEIACRIARTCRRLGIRTVAVFSDADRDARHVGMADEAVHIGASPAADSYLRVDRILDVARMTGAAAVHPGYGFLAENAGFARAVRDAGLAFVGPSPEAMERMGDKDSAKSVMGAAGVPLVPGYHGPDQADATLRAAADATGYPVMVKAAAGGGGKGMRRVERPAELVEALAACRREAMAAFGNDRLLIERLIQRPRHVEVQVFADRHGDVVHLFERDCTLQRRHQKVIEEAPAAGLDAAVRAALCSAAVAAARAAAYENAGTVEFLVTPDGGFFFIEMNTRLQVEHPVTELITGTDLVEWQLRITAGEPLPLHQSEIPDLGHAIEARLYAEDPERGFLPSTGRLDRLRLPFAARVETGVVEGDTVSPFYDPMIAKLIVHGPDRQGALALLAAALDDTVVAGPATNLAFLRRIVAAAPFTTMTIDTGWLDGEGALLAITAEVPGADDVAVAALCVVRGRGETARRIASGSGDPTSPFHGSDGWRMNAPHRQEVRFADTTIVVDAVRGGYEVDGRRMRIGDGWVEIDGRRETIRAEVGPAAVELARGGRRLRLALAAEAHAAGGDAAAAMLTAPMPGRITRLLVGVGDTVEPGATLAVMEAMKMEHRVTAGGAGRVTAVHVAEGEQVEEGTVLLDLEAVE